ncbi:MAG: HAD-IA family hydrolase [Pseudomonadota bacterium]
MRGEPGTVVFDLDGTLSDPAYGIAACVNYALREQDLAQAQQPAISALIGFPLDDIFRRLLSHENSDRGDRDVRADIDALVISYRERMTRIGYTENDLYPGVARLLQKLKEAGFRMGICTSKRTDIALQVLRYLQIEHYFGFVSGADVGVRKGQQLASLLHEGQISTNSVMVGDRASDIEAAAEVGVFSLGVLWGFGSQSELSAAKPDYIASEAPQIQAYAGCLLEDPMAQLSKGMAPSSEEIDAS